jgi:lysophospholipase L1-like esterase
VESLDDIKQIIDRDYHQKVTIWKKRVWKCKHLLVGDSMVAYYRPTIEMCQQGIAGDTTLGLLKRLDLIKLANPDHVLIHIGTNDIVLASLSIQDTIENLIQVKTYLNAYKVYILTPAPVIESFMSIHNHLRTQDHLKRLTYKIQETFNEDVIDIFNPFYHHTDMKSLYVEDGLHLNQKGYALYESIIKHYLGGL